MKSKTSGNKLKEYLFRSAVAAKQRDMQRWEEKKNLLKIDRKYCIIYCTHTKRGIYRKSSIYDLLVFNKIREKFGGNIVRMATGSAPIADEVMLFSKAAFGCPISEGYGQTESTCGITMSHPFDPKLGHCGPPLSCYMVKLIDVKMISFFTN